MLPSPPACPGVMNYAGLSLSLLSPLMLCMVLLYILSFIEGVASFSKSTSSESWMPVMMLILFLPSQLCAFLAFSLPLLSHLSFPSILVVGPHRSLLSPGPPVTRCWPNILTHGWGDPQGSLYKLSKPQPWKHLFQAPKCRAQFY